MFFLGTVEWGGGDKNEARRLFGEFLAAPANAEMPFWATYRAVAERLIAES